MKQAGLLLAVLWAGLVQAQTPEEQPYVRSVVESTGACTFLKDRTYVYSMDAAGSALTPGTTEFSAIDAAFATWQVVANTCTDLRFVRGPDLTNPAVGYNATPGASNTNVITFRETSCRDVVPDADPCIDDGSCANAYRCWDHGDFILALTTVSRGEQTGAIVDADIELNAAPHADGSRNLFTAVASPPCPADAPAPSCVAIDIQNTLTHEIGHVIGLDHTVSPDSTMAPTASIGETDKRILDSGTIQGLCDIYPRGQPSPTCDASNLTRKQIIAVTSGTALCAHGAGAPEGLAPLLVVLALLGLRARR